MNRFEAVSKYENIILPQRKTKNSAGYDFQVAKDTIIPAVPFRGKTYNNILTLDDAKQYISEHGLRPTLVPTGVKCQLDPDCYLELSVRSSTPLKYLLVLANGVGIIDADYYNNPDNEGEIFFQLLNFGPSDVLLRKGDTIGQGIIKHYLITEDDQAVGQRLGGFGSTSESHLNRT